MSLPTVGVNIAWEKEVSVILMLHHYICQEGQNSPGVLIVAMPSVSFKGEPQEFRVNGIPRDHSIPILLQGSRGAPEYLLVVGIDIHVGTYGVPIRSS